MPNHDVTNRRELDESTMNRMIDTARRHPTATAAAAAGAVGAVAAGVYLYSRRNDIGDHLSNVSEKITDWAGKMQSGDSSREMTITDGPNESSAIESSRETVARTNSTIGGMESRATEGQSRDAGQNMNAGRAGASTVSF